MAGLRPVRHGEAGELSKGPKPAMDLLRGRGSGDGTALADVLRRAGKLRRLDQALRSRLPADLAGHVHVANVRAARLVVIADSAAWATRLRFHGGNILQDLRSPDGGELRRLDIQVRPHGIEPRPKRRAQRPSPAACRNIESVAAHIEDNDLADALRRLARGKRD